MIAVVAGYCKDADGKILLSQRKKEQNQGLQWEFAGGKIEPNESPEDALQREWMEEMGVQTQTGKILDAIHKTIGDRDLLLLYYETVIVSGTPMPIDSNEIRFVAQSEIAQYDLCAIDRIFIERQLKRENV